MTDAEKAKFALQHGIDYDEFTQEMDDYLNQEAFRMDDDQLIEMFKYYKGMEYDGKNLF